MKPSNVIYTAANPVEAEIVKDYLAAHGVTVRIDGGFAWGAVGELPFPEAWPRLVLDRASDRERAKALLHDYEHADHGGVRCCGGCGEWVPESFAVCWSCGAAVPD